jgi:hypothetical protein
MQDNIASQPGRLQYAYYDDIEEMSWADVT